ncbi:hypothetical protein Cgig2_024015 [Carnegiea gigantea]|uniref:Uncharacterized protein n=1 Tax=Carnegiea gigantea TaxID=171969 RepID=A0A9Q1JR60_9CARY|nr:hypothetical protein Cgig2_024015 [Carnegiea gigantea]
MKWSTCKHCKNKTFIAESRYETSNMKKKLKKCLEYQATKAARAASEATRYDYKYLSAHYVDSNWKLHSKVLHFHHLQPPDTVVDLLKFIQCITHNLNLKVKIGMKEIDDCVVKIREIVKHVKGLETVSLIAKTKALWLHVPAGWNSTYYMLDKVLIYRRDLKNSIILILCIEFFVRMRNEKGSQGFMSFLDF